MFHSHSPPFDCHKDSWAVIQAFFQSSDHKQLVRHQIDSYNDFILNKIPNIIGQFNPVTICHDYDSESNRFHYEMHVFFGKTSIGPPKITENNGSSHIMYPSEARKRNLSYSAALYIDVTFKMNKLEQESMTVLFSKTFKRVLIGHIPIMLKSQFCVLHDKGHKNDAYFRECQYDMGGYFIINGSEKVIVSQECVATNKVLVFESSKKSTRYSHVVEIKAIPKHKFTTPKSTSIKITSKEDHHGQYLRVFLPNLKSEIPVCVLFRALGILTDKAIARHIIYDLDNPNHKTLIRLFKASMIEAEHIRTQEEA
ncbi:MAG: hypothetical protein CMI53_04340, partial [Parcubacteria group bacterium]|nr:hypothetical protein [Parcubacteria group bacterium]